jgi:hypothetical protein
MRAFFFVLTSFPVLALAHPGHSPFPADRALHYLATPEHAGGLVVLLVTAGAIVFGSWARRRWPG